MEETLKLASTSFPIVVLASAALLAVPAGQAAEVSVEDRWPGWRGDGQGIVRGGRLPLEWTAARNVAW